MIAKECKRLCGVTVATKSSSTRDVTTGRDVTTANRSNVLYERIIKKRLLQPSLTTQESYLEKFAPLCFVPDTQTTSGITTDNTAHKFLDSGWMLANFPNILHPYAYFKQYEGLLTQAEVNEVRKSKCFRGEVNEVRKSKCVSAVGGFWGDINECGQEE